MSTRTFTGSFAAILVAMILVGHLTSAENLVAYSTENGITNGSSVI